jgi:hypothetical protein
MKHLIWLIFLVVLPRVANSQDTIPSNDPNFLYSIVRDGDTIYAATIKEIHVTPLNTFESKRDWRRYQRLIRNIKIVYPYAKMARKKYDEVVVEYAKLKTDKEKKDYMKKVEVDLKNQFEGELKNLTISQGRILIKLVDREIGMTTYDILQEYRGNFSAFFWQTLAKLFGNNLKSTFDAEGEDKMINDIIVLIDEGQL